MNALRYFFIVCFVLFTSLFVNGQVKAQSEPSAAQKVFLPVVMQHKDQDCSEPIVATSWMGTNSYRYTVKAEDTSERWSDSRSATITATLNITHTGPSGITYLGVVVGEATIDTSSYLRIGAELELQSWEKGVAAPTPLNLDTLEGARVGLNFDYENCQYNFTSTIFARVTHTDSFGTSERESLIGDLSSAFYPMPSGRNPSLQGSRFFPVRSTDYVIQHGVEDWYRQNYGSIVNILGEENLGSAEVSWHFWPVE